MKIIFILSIYVGCVKCSILLRGIFEKEELIIPTEIIGNNLHKYLNYNEEYVSIALSSSSNDQHLFQQDLVSNLVTHTKLSNFSFNVLNTLDQSRRENIDVFNLIFIDGSETALT